MDAMRGIHSVSDKVLFEKPLDKDSKATLVNSNVQADKIEAARLGYKFDDNTHVEYQILNGVSGFNIFYHAIDINPYLPSKVDSTETIEELNSDQYLSDETDKACTTTSLSENKGKPRQKRKRTTTTTKETVNKNKTKRRHKQNRTN